MEIRENRLTPDGRTSGATAAVLLNDKRAGSAVLVDDGHLLTAGHVLGDYRSHEHLEIKAVFPQVGLEVVVEVVDLGEMHTMDLAVLRVLDSPAGALPDPVELSPDDRLPDVVAAYGFPWKERALEGVWREFTVSGRTTSGTRQVSWNEDVGTFVGHSGGPVVDPANDQLVGILLAGSEDGHFDRFLALPQIAEVWSELQRPWKYAGLSARTHFNRNARGGSGAAQGGDLFRGRDAALAAIDAWVAGESRRRPLVIVGRPGSGKSAVLARAALAAERSQARGLVHHALGTSVEEFFDVLAGFFGTSTPQDIDGLIAKIEQLDLTRTTTIMVDALDEARSIADVHAIAEAIADLAHLPNIRIVVATRPLAAGNRFRQDGLLQTLRVSGDASSNLVDLDVEPYRDRKAIQAYTEAVLAQDDADRPGPAGCAWEFYRADDDLRRGLAKIIAERADPNFLVAAVTSMTLSKNDVVLDHRSPDFDPATIPTTLGNALKKYLSSMDEPTKQQVLSLLTALSYARGAGISEVRWIRFAGRLGYPATRADLDTFRRSPGTDFLVQSEAADGDFRIRLFHQALIDEFRRPRPRPDERHIYESLLEDVVSAGGWSAADVYLTTHMADHAAACKNLPTLLEDHEYIGVADVSGLLSALGTLDPAECPEVGQLVLQEGLRLKQFEPHERLWLLAMSAVHAGMTATKEKLLSAQRPALSPQWAHALGASYQKLVGHTHSIHALTIGRLGREEVIVSGGTDMRILVWDHKGNLLVDPLEGHQGSITALATGIVDDEDVIVSGSSDKTVMLWNVGSGQPKPPFIGHTKPVMATRIIQFEGEDAVVSVAPGGEILVWNADGQVLRRFTLDSSLATIGSVEGRTSIVGAGYRSFGIFSPVEGHVATASTALGPKTALATGRLGNTDVLACSLDDASIVLSHTDGTLARQPLLGHSQLVRCITIGKLRGMDVIVSGSDDSIIVWSFRATILSTPWVGHTGAANVVAIGSFGRRDVVACAGDDKVVRIWEERALLRRGPTNRRHRIQSFAVGTVADDLRIITSTEDGLQLWDEDGNLLGTSSAEAHTRLRQVAIEQCPGAETMVSIDYSNEVHLWDLAGRLIGTIITPSRVNQIAVGTCDGRRLIATAGRDKTVRLWDEHGDEVDCLTTFGNRPAHRLAFGRFGGRDSLAVLGGDRVVRIWDLAERKWSHRSPGSSWGGISCLAMCTIDGVDVLAIGCQDGRIRTWQAGQQSYRVSQERHSAGIVGLAFANLADRTTLITTGGDSVLRIWHDMRSPTKFPLAELASAPAVVGTRVVIASGPALSVLRHDPTSAGRGPSRPDDSFTSTSALTIEDVVDATADHVNHLNHIRYARSVLAAGDADEAVRQLLPHLRRVPAAVCLAADAAWTSRQQTLIDLVLPHLEADRLQTHLPAQTRLLALAIFTGQFGAAVSASTAIGRSKEPCAIDLIQFLGAFPQGEWQVYSQAALTFGEPATGDDHTFADYLTEIAAMRLLAICRGMADENVELFREHRDELIGEYWNRHRDAVLERLMTTLRDYCAAVGEPNLPLPYQVISIYEVVVSAAPLPPEFRDELVGALVRRLRVMTQKVRTSFAAWATFSDFAATVVDRLVALKILTEENASRPASD